MDQSTKIILTAIFALILWSLRDFFKWLHSYTYHQWVVRNIPGPENKFLIGSAHLIKNGVYGFPEFILEQSSRMIEQGEGLMRIWLGPMLRIYLFDPDLIKVITNHTTELRKGKDYDRLHPWLGSGLITADGGEKWKINRRLLTPAFHFGKLEEYAETMDRHAQELVEVLRGYSDGKQHDIYELIKCMSLDTIAETAMGIELNTLRNPDQEYIKAVDTYNYLVFFRGAVPYYLNGFIWWFSGYARQQNEALRVLKSTSSEVIRKRVEILKQGFDEVKRRPDFLDILLGAYQEGKMSFEEMRQEVDNFLFAGYDTTSHAISWSLWCLATHPQIQEKLFNEISKKLDGSVDIVADQLKDLPYFNAVIKEVLRVYPSVPGFQRNLQNDLKIGKYLIPKGANVIVSTYAMHHNEKFYKNHWEFNPENFLGDKEYPPNAYVPFSAGLRNCIGQKFAMREIRIVLAHLILNFKFTTQHKMLENKPIIKIVLTPTLGVPVKIQSRH